MDELGGNSFLIRNLFDRADESDVNVRQEPLTNTTPVAGLPAWRFNGGATGIDLPASPVGELVLCFDDRALADLWIVIHRIVPDGTQLMTGD